jgi:hypothetical protein
MTLQELEAGAKDAPSSPMLISGAGDAKVRAGVMKLLSTSSTRRPA